MKHIYLIVTFISLILTTNGQGLYRYPQPRLLQGEIWYFWDSGPNVISNISFKYISDTVISDTTYSLFYSKYFSPYYTRYDNGKVYEVGRNNDGSLSGQEVLKYDFSLNLNDTFYFKSGYFGGSKAVVDSVSSITLLNGQIRKYLRLFLYGFGYFQWVDGIGDIDNGFYYIRGNEDYEEFVCQSDSSGLVWVNPSVSMNCDSLTDFSTDIKPFYNNNFKLYPNPATDKVEVSGGQSACGGAVSSIEIYNLLGEKVYTSPFTGHCSPITINIAAFPSGVYVVEVKTESGVEVRKFIKE